MKIRKEKVNGIVEYANAAMKKNKAQKWLSDDRTNTVVRKADVAWGDENWVPQTIEAGWKGRLEDRRPASNGDPYKIGARIIKTVKAAKV